MNNISENNDLSLKMSSVYKSVFTGILPMFPKAFLLLVIFYIPYILVRIFIDPSFSEGMNPIGINQAILAYNKTQSVTEFLNVWNALDKRVLLAEGLKVITSGLLLFNIFYLCVNFANSLPLNLKCFFTLEYQKKFFVNILVQIFVCFLGLGIGALSIGAIIILVFFGVLLFGAFPAHWLAVALSVIVALLGFVLICAAFCSFILGLSLLEAYTRIITVSIISGEYKFKTCFVESYKLLKGNMLKVGAFALVNILGIFLFGASNVLWILPLQLLFAKLNLPLWIFQMITKTPLIVVANIFVFLFYATLFNKLKDIAVAKANVTVGGNVLREENTDVLADDPQSLEENNESTTSI